MDVTSGSSLWIATEYSIYYPDFMEIESYSVNEFKMRKPKKRTSYRRSKEGVHSTIAGKGHAGRALR